MLSFYTRPCNYFCSTTCRKVSANFVFRSRRQGCMHHQGNKDVLKFCVVPKLEPWFVRRTPCCLKCHIMALTFFAVRFQAATEQDGSYHRHIFLPPIFLQMPFETMKKIFNFFMNFSFFPNSKFS